MPARFAAKGDPHLAINEPGAAGALDGLLELAARDEASGLADAPWPPHFRKTEGEAARVAPSRARKRAGTPAETQAKTEAEPDGASRPTGARRSKMPLVVVANSTDKQAALEGLARWKRKYPEAAAHLALDDVLVDSMRGRSSTWTRIRVNLRHVPAAERPPQGTPGPDDDPTRAWREAMRAHPGGRRRKPGPAD